MQLSVSNITFPTPNYVYVLRIISCAFFLKELFVRANRKCIFTGNYVRAGRLTVSNKSPRIEGTSAYAIEKNLVWMFLSFLRDFFNGNSGLF